MKNPLHLIAIALISILFSGCVSVSKQELASASFSPLPSSYQDDIQRLMSSRLKDPDSAKYYFGSPRKGVAQDGLLLGGKKHFGYIVPTGINAKNSYGGYTGQQMYYFLFSDGMVYDITSSFGGGMARFVE